MSSLDRKPGKSPGHELQPARIVLESGDEFTVAHHFIHKSAQWVCAYETEPDGGIDYRFSAATVAYIDTSDNAEQDVTPIEETDLLGVSPE